MYAADLARSKEPCFSCLLIDTGLIIIAILVSALVTFAIIRKFNRPLSSDRLRNLVDGYDRDREELNRAVRMASAASDAEREQIRRGHPDYGSIPSLGQRMSDPTASPFPVVPEGRERS